MNLVEFLGSVNEQNIKLTLHNELILNNYEQLYFLHLEKDNKALDTCINVSYPVDDCVVVDWLCGALKEFESAYVRKSEYSTPINQNLGILGE